MAWLLLTTLPVGNADQRRPTSRHICPEAAVTIQAVIALRLVAPTLIGRDNPEPPDHRMFSAFEVAWLLDSAIAGGFPAPGRERTENPADFVAVSLGQALLLATPARRLPEPEQRRLNAVRSPFLSG